MYVYNIHIVYILYVIIHLFLYLDITYIIESYTIYSIYSMYAISSIKPIKVPIKSLHLVGRHAAPAPAGAHGGEAVVGVRFEAPDLHQVLPRAAAASRLFCVCGDHSEGFLLAAKAKAESIVSIGIFISYVYI
jgi:hypothetical protein